LADNASASQVKNQMEACSETKIDMKTAAYETAGKMKAVLTSEQKEQLKNTMMQGGMMNKNRGGMMQNNGGGMMQNQNNQ
jgi:Spy/CpxP family protein refolding chaperone